MLSLIGVPFGAHLSAQTGSDFGSSGICSLISCLAETQHSSRFSPFHSPTRTKVVRGAHNSVRGGPERARRMFEENPIACRQEA
jgi:hypothetical protein